MSIYERMESSNGDKSGMLICNALNTAATMFQYLHHTHHVTADELIEWCMDAITETCGTDIEPLRDVDLDDLGGMS